MERFTILLYIFHVQYKRKCWDIGLRRLFIYLGNRPLNLDSLKPTIRKVSTTHRQNAGPGPSPKRKMSTGTLTLYIKQTYFRVNSFSTILSIVSKTPDIFE